MTDKRLVRCKQCGEWIVIDFDRKEYYDAVK